MSRDKIEISNMFCHHRVSIPIFFGSIFCFALTFTDLILYGQHLSAQNIIMLLGVGFGWAGVAILI